MRIVVDVSPLSHPPTGHRQLHPRLARRAGRGGAAERHEIVAFAPTSLSGPGRIRAGARRHPDVEPALWPLPASHAVRTAWSVLGHPPAERLLGRFDVLHFTDWMYPPQRARRAGDDDPRPRPAPPPGVVHAADDRRCTGASTRTPRAPATSIFANSALHRPTTSCDARRRAASGSSSRIPASTPSSRPTGRGAPLGAPVRARRRRRSSRARTSHALVEASRLLGDEHRARRSPAAPAGASSPGSTTAASSGSGYVADEELARLYRGAAVVRLPVALRGLRDAGRRGDGVRHAGRRLGPSRRSTRRAGTAAVRVDPDDPDAIAAAIARGARATRRARARAGLAARRAVHLARRRARRCCAALTRRRGEGRHRRLAARADAAPARRGYVRGLLGALERRPGLEVAPADVRGGHGRCDGARARRRLVLRPARRARRAALDVLHCTTFRGAAAAPGPRRRHGARPRRAPPPGALPALARALPAALGPAPTVRAADARRRRLRVHAARGRSSCSASPAARDRRRAERRRPGVHARRPGRRGRLRARGRDARAAQEPAPASSRRRGAPASSCASSAPGAGAASRCRVWLGRCHDDELAALYRGARCLVYPVALRGLRDPGRSRRWRAGRRS